jgi:hypothetical protein
MEAMMRRQPLLWAARGGFFRVVVMVTCRHPQVSRAVFILADFCTYYYDECGILFQKLVMSRVMMLDVATAKFYF